MAGLFLAAGFPCLAQVPDHLWTRHWGGTSDDHNGGIAIATDANIFSLSTVYPSCTFDPASNAPQMAQHGGSDILLVKYDTLGSIIWGGKMGGPGFDFGKGLSVNDSGAVYITGSISSSADMDPSTNSYPVNSSGGYDIVLAKYDVSGSIEWAFAMGGSDDDWGNSVVATQDGGVLVTGTFNDSTDFDPDTAVSMLYSHGDADIFIAKYTASGHLEWVDVIGGPEGDESSSIDIDERGNAYITGFSRIDADFDPGPSEYILDFGCNRAFLASYTASGTFRWAFAFGASCSSHGVCVKTAIPGAVYTTGHFGFSSDFDPGPEVHSLDADSGGAYLAKYDLEGRFIWAVNYGIVQSTGYSLSTDSNGSVYTAGLFVGQMDGNPGQGVAMLVSVPDQWDIFVSKFTALGVWQWSGSVSGEYGFRRDPRIEASGAGLYLSGDYYNTADFDLGPSEANSDPDPSHGIFLARYSPSSESNTMIPQGEAGEQLFAFPNPAIENVCISVTAAFRGGSLVISDMLGRAWVQKTVSFDRTLVDVRQLPRGPYVITLKHTCGVISRKLILD